MSVLSVIFLNLSIEALWTLDPAGPGLVRAGSVRQRYPKFTQDCEHQAEEFKGQAPEAKRPNTLPWKHINTDGMKRNKGLLEKIL